jgi:hypothetical protein
MMTINYDRLSKTQKKLLDALVSHAREEDEAVEVYEVSLDGLLKLMGYPKERIEVLKKDLGALQSRKIRSHSLSLARNAALAAHTLLSRFAVTEDSVRYTFSPLVKRALFKESPPSVLH